MGDELGMLDTPIPASEVQDPAETREPGKGIGRDPVRTPFPWQSRPGAGFTTGRPWLRLGTDTPLSVQRDDPTSMVSLYRALLALRRQHPALALGRVDCVTVQGSVLSFRRIADGESLAVLANIGSTPTTAAAVSGEITLSTRGDRLNEKVADTLALRADEAVILRLDTAD
jgi:alpha-glucosidase